MIFEPQTTPAGIVSAVVLLLMLIGVLCHYIWLPFVAAIEEWWWGFVVFLIPGAGLLFAILHWDESRMPFLLGWWCMISGFCMIFLVKGTWEIFVTNGL